MHFLDAVLDLLDRDLVVFDLAFEIGGDMKRDELDDAGVILLAQRVERLGYRCADLPDGEVHNLAVTLHYLIHMQPPA